MAAVMYVYAANCMVLILMLAQSRHMSRQSWGYQSLPRCAATAGSRIDHSALARALWLTWMPARSD